MKLLLFGIAKEIVGAPELEVPAMQTVADLKTFLCEKYPQFKSLNSLAIAIDKEYADDGQTLQAHAEIALIPPVSGG